MHSVEIHLLTAAIAVISSALVFYTVGVWGERLQHGLRLWHVVFFLLGIAADITGTTLMEHIARLTHAHDRIHTVTGGYRRRTDAHPRRLGRCNLFPGIGTGAPPLQPLQRRRLVHLADSLLHRRIYRHDRALNPKNE